MLRLLIDTSTWLDLAKRRNGQRWIVALRVLRHQKKVELLVPEVVIDEFARNRARIEASMTASVAERFRLLRKDLSEYGSDDQAEALEIVDGLAHHVPLVGAMATRNFDDIAELLAKGEQLSPTDDQRGRVVERGLDKRAPFHRGRNSVADAVLMELYVDATATADLAVDPHAFVTSNSDDFSVVAGDKREPHADFAAPFASDGSSYALGVDGLDAVLVQHFGEEAEELFEELDFREDPRRLDEILQAEQGFFDRIWYQRSLNRLYRQQDAGEPIDAVAVEPRRAMEEKYGPDGLGPWTDFEWGMLNGKLSALRWVLGSDWDFLDT